MFFLLNYGGDLVGKCCNYVRIHVAELYEWNRKWNREIGIEDPEPSNSDLEPNRFVGRD